MGFRRPGDDRFIPACAGNSAGRRRRRWKGGGSSPRVRGTLRLRLPVQRGRRFIPACAGNSGRRAPRTVRDAVHPRVCGELLREAALVVRRAGSSPRVRGTRHPCPHPGPECRFIPACAGNSIVRGRTAPRNTVRFIGSSPRVRGTLYESYEVADVFRFIPACAGNSYTDTYVYRIPAVHPRVCGELGGRDRAGRARLRFIPACAGNSTPRAATLPYSAVHPRVCGELDELGLTVTRGDGSSPRVRGTRPHHLRPAVEPGRFIPACAGNSGPDYATSGEQAVHPRVCGELVPRQGLRRGRSGSSPRVRGTPRGSASYHHRRRFIPACAGNSSRGGQPVCGEPVHPRVCGELLLKALSMAAVRGSSPRVRGTPAPPLQQAGGFRFIPACAGNSAAE